MKFPILDAMYFMDSGYDLDDDHDCIEFQDKIYYRKEFDFSIRYFHYISEDVKSELIFKIYQDRLSKVWHKNETFEGHIYERVWSETKKRKAYYDFGMM